MIQLLVTLLPTLISLIHVTEASIPAPGNGAQKQQTVLDILRTILQQFPALDAKVEPFLTLVKPIITVYVALSNMLGWNPAVQALATSLVSETQAPAPVVDAAPVAVDSSSVG